MIKMNEEDFTKQVLEVIKRNAFVVKKILFSLEDCIPKSDLDEAESKLRQAQLKLERLEREDAEKNSRIDDLLRRQREFDAAQEKISQLEMALAERTTLLEEKTGRLAAFEENYFELERAFKVYENLSAGTKFALEGVFGTGTSPINFLVGALQEGHLESLFDYVAINLNNDSNPDESETLRHLFDFSFNAVNGGRREKIFSRLDVREGDDFASAEMRKTSDSPQSGTVQKILLVGYKYLRTNKVVRPSLVFLG